MNYLKYLFLTTCAFTTGFWNPTLSQNFSWAKSIGGSSADYGYSNCVDAFGNIYSTGMFAGTVDFDPGPGTANLIGQGISQIFVLKLDSAGNFLWAKSIGGPSSEWGQSICVDSLGNIFVTGGFSATVDFDPGPGTTNLTSSGAWDAFVLKLDGAGNFMWAKAFGGFSDDYGQSITVDPSGNVILTGGFQSTVDFDPGTGTSMRESIGGRDIFVQKLDEAGNFIWAKTFGGQSLDMGNSITTDLSGNIITTGQFSENVDFDPNDGIEAIASSGKLDIFIQKLDPQGNYIWAKTMGGSLFDDAGTSVAADQLGNIVTTGYFQVNVDFDPGPGILPLSSEGKWDVFIQKLKPNGDLLWAKSFGGSETEYNSCIRLDNFGNVYSTGSFFQTIDFDPGPGTANLSAEGMDIFLQKLDAMGNFIWAKSFGGSSSDAGNSLVIDRTGKITSTGYFTGIADFDPSNEIFSLSSSGEPDIFLQQTIQTTTGITNLVEGVKIMAFPNPSCRGFMVSIDNPFQIFSLEITDSHGQKVYSKKSYGILSEYIPMDVTAGIYYLRVKGPTDQAVLRLIKE